MLTNGGHHHVFRPAPIRLLTRALHVEAKAATTIKGIPEILRTTLVTAKASLSEVFHEKKEQEPGGKRDKILYHRPKDTSSILRSLRQL